MVKIKELFFLSLFVIFLSSTLSKLTVKSPKELRDRFGDGRIEASLSNFGRIPYGFKMYGKVYYDVNNKDQDMACQDITSIHIPETHNVDEAPIVLIERGNCTFVTKVRHVEDIGGHVAVIMNNVHVPNINNIIMADDGHGKNITIPALLIAKEDGDILRDFIMKNKNKPDILEKIVLEVDFQMEHLSNRVDYKMYFRSDNEKVYKFMSGFDLYHKALGENIRFVPHYVTYKHPSYDPDNLSQIVDNCIGGGRYCVTPENKLIPSGREIIFENLRQKCIYNWAQTSNRSDLYWDYMKLFYNECIKSAAGVQFNEECGAKATVLANIPVADISKCIAESYVYKGQQTVDTILTAATTNKILDEDNESKRDYNLKYIPSIVVNGRTIWGDWTTSNIFEAICASYFKKPEICYKDGVFKRSETSVGTIIFIILLVATLNIIIFILCKKYISKRINERVEETDINHKINTVVTSYLALKDTK